MDDAFGSLRGFTRWLFVIALIVAVVAFLMGKREWLDGARKQAARAYGAGKRGRVRPAVRRLDPQPCRCRPVRRADRRRGAALLRRPVVGLGDRARSPGRALRIGDALLAEGGPDAAAPPAT